MRARLPVAVNAEDGVDVGMGRAPQRQPRRHQMLIVDVVQVHAARCQVAAGSSGGTRITALGSLGCFAATSAVHSASTPASTSGCSNCPPSTDVRHRGGAAAAQAAASYHGVLIHLGFTHLISEAITLAAVRNLAAVHPVAVLLGRHFDGTMSINKLASTC